MSTRDPLPWQRPGRLPTETEIHRLQSRYQRPTTSNYQPERRIETPVRGNHHCPYCPAYIRATFRNSNLVAVDLVHSHRAVCRGAEEPQPVEPWLGGQPRGEQN